MHSSMPINARLQWYLALLPVHFRSTVFFPTSFFSKEQQIRGCCKINEFTVELLTTWDSFFFPVKMSSLSAQSIPFVSHINSMPATVLAPEWQNSRMKKRTLRKSPIDRAIKVLMDFGFFVISSHLWLHIWGVESIPHFAHHYQHFMIKSAPIPSGNLLPFL